MRKRSPNGFEKFLRVVIALAIVTAIGAAVAFSMPSVVKELPKQIRFLGRFHVLALHVPIGILVLALIAEGATFFRRGRRMGDVVVGFALTMLVLTGVASVLLGLILAHDAHYPHKLVAPHRNLTILGLWFAAMARLVWARRRSRWLLRLLIAASAGTMMVGAHFGGSMTHGEDYLLAPVEDKPAPIVEEPDASPPVLVTDGGAPLAAIPVDAGIADASTDAAAADAGLVDAGPPKPTARQLAQGIVNRKCSPCHTTGSKGGLRLTDVAHPTKRGVLKPGNPEGSTMYTNLLLPKDDDDHMPPENETQLTKSEIAIIRAFITEQR